MIQPIEWHGDNLRLLDQTALPYEKRYATCNTWRDVEHCIKTMVVRGAPAIGISAAFGMVLAIQQLENHDRWLEELSSIAEILSKARPTAVNLMWAINRMVAQAKASGNYSDATSSMTHLAVQMMEEDIAVNKLIGKHGAELLPGGANVLTICNAGALATAGYGTALGIIRYAHETGLLNHVYACETRPRLQGMKLTMWELIEEGIPATLIPDSSAAYLMAMGKISAVITGCDRVAANGDAANKLGTYMLAVSAKHHGIPFYIAAPTSTIDVGISNGEAIPIEIRDDDEVVSINGVRIAPAGVKVWNPAFDVTPGELITAIITERGVLKPPYNISV